MNWHSRLPHMSLRISSSQVILTHCVCVCVCDCLVVLCYLETKGVPIDPDDGNHLISKPTVYDDLNQPTFLLVNIVQLQCWKSLIYIGACGRTIWRCLWGSHSVLEILCLAQLWCCTATLEGKSSTCELHLSKLCLAPHMCSNVQTSFLLLKKRSLRKRFERRHSFPCENDFSVVS